MLHLMNDCNCAEQLPDKCNLKIRGEITSSHLCLIKLIKYHNQLFDSNYLN